MWKRVCVELVLAVALKWRLTSSFLAWEATAVHKPISLRGKITKSKALTHLLNAAGGEIIAPKVKDEVRKLSNMSVKRSHSLS